MLEEYKQSKLKAAEFCRQRGLSVHSFRKWQQAEKIATIKYESEFIQVAIGEPVIRKEPLIVCYGSYEIKVPEAYEKGHLEGLLDVLEARNAH
jgi:hypothetical protein